MKSLLGLDREALLALDPAQVTWLLTADEVFYMSAVLEGYWSYDYDALEAGRPGKHARLKSSWHSDGFFFAKAILEHDNLRFIMADQIVQRLRTLGVPKPDHVIGVPASATELGRAVAELLGAQFAEMKKDEQGHMQLETVIPAGDSVLLVEDICTKGTGFKEAVGAVLEDSPDAIFVFVDPVILSRGGTEEIVIEDVGTFQVLPVVERRIQDWAPEACPLCKRGSEAIRPKAEPGNWPALTSSQK